MRPTMMRRRVATIVAVTAVQLVFVTEAFGAPSTNVLVQVTVQPAPDITLPIWLSDYAWANGHGNNVWTAHAPQSTPGYETKQGHAGESGLWMWPIGGGKYAPGSAGFSFRAPGTTRIARADLDVSYRQNLYASHCTSIGLRIEQETRASDNRCVVPESDQIDVDKDGSVASRTVKLWDPSGSPTSKELFTYIVIPDCDKPTPACDRNVPALDPLRNGPFLRVHNVAMTLVDDDLPVVTPSKAFYELDGEYIDGKQTYPLQIDASDAGAGLTHTQFDHTDPYGAKAALDESNPFCDPTHNTPSLESRICPPTDEIDTIVDTRPMPEGTNRFHAWSQDLATNIGDSNWTVIVDRTPPPAPPNVRFLTPDEGSGQVDWDESVDPVLADGTPGSGTTTYQFRSRAAGGGWSEWKEISASRRISDENFDHPAGTLVEFEVVALDLVRNVSAPSYASGTVWGTQPSIMLNNELADLHEEYTNGQVVIPLTVGTVDDTAGMRSSSLTLVNALHAAVSASCVDAGLPYAPGKRHCPNQLDWSTAIDSRTLAEGQHRFTIQAEDRAHNVSSELLELNVDRTPPGPVSGAEAEADSGSVNASVTWEEADDPELAPGIDGSGYNGAHYRYRVDSGSWSDWSFDGNSIITARGASIGSVVHVETKSIDEVGNVGASHDFSVSVTETDDPETDEQDSSGGEALFQVNFVDLTGAQLAPAANITFTAEGAGFREVATASGNGTVSFESLPDEGPITISAIDEFGESMGVVATVTDWKKLMDEAFDAMLGLGYIATQEERDLCRPELMWPFCANFYMDSRKAYKYAERLFTESRDKSDSTRVNAFQHSYWLALMVNSVYWKNYLDDDKVGFAYDMADAHEANARRSGAGLAARRASAMDIVNNDRGYNLAVANKGGDRRKNDYHYCKTLREKSKTGSIVKGKFSPDTSNWKAGRGPQADRVIYYRPRTDDQNDPRTPKLLKASQFSNSKPCQSE